jgi:Leucine-rich repeat (LRR) protein
MYKVGKDTNFTKIIEEVSSEPTKGVYLICTDDTNIPELTQGTKALSDTGLFSSLLLHPDTNPDIYAPTEIPETDTNYIYLLTSDLSDEQYEYIIAILRGNTKFMEFISNSKIKGAKSKYLADALKENNTLKKLCLIGAEIEDQETESIIDVMKGNTTLTTLSLQQNEITDIGVSNLTNVLAKNTTLTELNLSYNPIKNKGAMDIADLLKKNDTLMNLDFSYNGPGDQYYIAGAGQNWVGDQGTRCIADALKINKGLSTLSFGSSLFGETTVSNDTGWYILDCLKTNKALLHVQLSEEPIYNEIKSEVERLCERNKLRYLELIKFINYNQSNINPTEDKAFDTFTVTEEQEQNGFTKIMFCTLLNKLSLSYLKAKFGPKLVDDFKHIVDANFFKISGICNKFPDDHPIKNAPKDIIVQITHELPSMVWEPVIATSPPMVLGQPVIVTSAQDIALKLVGDIDTCQAGEG